jgi:hypothetical protein
MISERRTMRKTLLARPQGWRATVVLLATTVALSGVLLAQTPASAHDHRVPRTALMEGKQELQVGRKVDEYSWTTTAGGGACVRADAILDFRFPRGVPTVEPESKLRVRIHKAQKPRSFEIMETDESGQATGEVGIRLKPVVRDDRTVAWDAGFRLNRPDAEYRLKAAGLWRDREGCGPTDQFAFWSFRVNTSSPSSG